MIGITPFIGLGTVIGLILALWVYIDAQDHGQDGLVWAVIVFFLQIPALIVYFLFFRQGIAPAEKHTAVSRSDDFLYRSKYRTQDLSGDRKKATMAGVAPPDPDFSDPELERLISERKLSEARGYLKDMIQIAREMNDQKSLRNYKKYELILAKMSRGSSRFPR